MGPTNGAKRNPNKKVQEEKSTDKELMEGEQQQTGELDEQSPEMKKEK